MQRIKLFEILEFFFKHLKYIAIFQQKIKKIQ